MNRSMTEKKILLVDDNSMCLQFMEIILEDKYILKLAYNGEEALEIAENFKPDLIVLDVMMPGIDGYEVSRMLHNNDPTGNTKIVFVSAKEPSIEEQILINTNGYAFLLKPFAQDEFDNQVEKILAA